MTVKELIDLLSQEPQAAEVWVFNACHGCWKPATDVDLERDGRVTVSALDGPKA